MKRVWIFAFALLGCANRYRTEYVGTVVGNKGAIELPRGMYDVVMRFDIPRAQQVHWHLQCPGTERSGAVGETFEAYRERRLGELRDMVRRDRERAAAAANLVGALAPRAKVVTPNGTVEARVTPQVQVDEAEPLVELAPGDDGRGRLDAVVRIVTQAPGACTIAAEAGDRIAASYAITRVRDLVAEREEHAVAVRTGAIDTRTRVRGQLVAYGADEGARERRLAEQARLEAERNAKLEADRRARAEADARLEAERRAQREVERRERAARLAVELRVRRERELRIRLELQAKAEAAARAKWEAEAPMRAHAELVARWRIEAIEHREVLLAWLVGTCHADAGRRERIAHERELRIEAERAERIRIRIAHEHEVALRLEAEREERTAAERAERARAEREAALRAERERVHLRVALEVRSQLTASLLGFGARMRPPRPGPRFERPGAAPFPDARWIAGHWEFHTTEWAWAWIAGGWSDPDRFGDTGGEVVVTAAPPSPAVVVETPTTVTTTTIDVTPPSVGVTVHVPPVHVPLVNRRGAPSPRRPAIRPSRTQDRPVVRDHRRGRRPRDDRR